MCITVPTGISATCKKQQLSLIRCERTGDYVVTYRSIIECDRSVKSFAFTVPKGTGEHISKESSVECFSEFLEEEKIIYRSLSVLSPPTIGLDVIERYDGAFVLSFKLSDLTEQSMSEHAGVATKCMETLLQLNGEKVKVLNTLFGEDFQTPTTADEISDLVTSNEKVMLFFGEMIEAICGLWVPGDDLIMVIPSEENRGMMMQLSTEPRTKRVRKQISVLVDLTFWFPKGSTKFPIIGLQHNHDTQEGATLAQHEDIDDYFLITNISNDIVLPGKSFVVRKHELLYNGDKMIAKKLAVKYGVLIKNGVQCFNICARDDCSMNSLSLVDEVEEVQEVN